MEGKILKCRGHTTKKGIWLKVETNTNIKSETEKCHKTFDLKYKYITIKQISEKKALNDADNMEKGFFLLTPTQ